MPQNKITIVSKEKVSYGVITKYSNGIWLRLWIIKNPRTGEIQRTYTIINMKIKCCCHTGDTNKVCSERVLFDTKIKYKFLDAAIRKDELWRIYIYDNRS